MPSGERRSQASVEPSPAVPTGPEILLIEDEPGIVDFVRRGLEARGLRA